MSGFEKDLPQGLKPVPFKLAHCPMAQIAERERDNQNAKIRERAGAAQDARWARRTAARLPVRWT